VKAYEYYMDEEFLESYYRNQGSIFLYNDGNVYYSLSPYNENLFAEYTASNKREDTSSDL